MKFRVMTLAIVALSLQIQSIQSASAELIAYEGFFFDGPGVAGQGSGFGWNDNEEDGPVGWINSAGDFLFVTNDGLSLDSPAHPFTPVGNRVQLPETPRASNSVAARELRLEDRVDMSLDGGQLYLSFLIRKDGWVDAAGSNNLEAGLYAGGAAVARLGISSNDQFFVTMTSSAAAGQTSEDFVNYGETYFVVLKAVSSSIGDDQIFAQIYDSTMSPPTVEPTEWDLTASSSTNATINRVRMQVGQRTWGALDEFRVGTTFASVVGDLPPVGIPGDFNGDTFVDGQDLAIWETAFGVNANADANGDGNSDGADFLIWQRNYAPPSAMTAVPEPGALALTLLGLACFVVRRNRV
jgi:hypothetical protein